MGQVLDGGVGTRSHVSCGEWLGQKGGSGVGNMAGGVGTRVRWSGRRGRARGENGLTSGTGGGLWFAWQLAACHASGGRCAARLGWRLAGRMGSCHLTAWHLLKLWVWALFWA